MTILSLDAINTYYGSIHVLKDVSLEVNQGEIVSLIGSNGAGKTTILKTISGLLKPRAGVIHFKEQRIDLLPPHEVAARGVAHVPEGRHIFPRLTVLENLEMGAFRFNDKKSVNEKIEEVFAIFPRLHERKAQKGGTLSGGEQQMLAIGRAMMSRPEILLLDEPSMGLSPLLVEQIFQVIKELNKGGMTILLVEQNANKALKIAHRGYVLQTGKIVLTGTGEELLADTLVQEAYLG